MTAELAIREGVDLAPRFVVTLDEMKRQLEELERFKREIMVEGEDYGVIPGTSKPALYKPGAEKLTLAFGLAPTFVNVGKVEDWDSGLFHYEESCVLTNRRTGDVVASASGSANTREPRYRWRKAERVCPECGTPAILKSRQADSPGWFCWRKKDGCSVTFAEHDPRITGQVVGQMANPEPFELVNTIKKMAQKRALVAAVLIATGGSGTWAQDVEDMPSMAPRDEPNGVTVIEQPPQQQAAAAPARSRAKPPAQQAAPPPAETEPMVTKADERIWKRWLDLLAESKALEIAVAPLALPVSRATLAASGTALFDQITAAREHNQAAPVDDATTGAKPPDAGEGTAPASEPADEPIMVTKVRHALNQELAALMETAAGLGIDVSEYQTPLPAPATIMHAKIEALKAAILTTEEADESGVIPPEPPEADEAS